MLKDLLNSIKNGFATVAKEFGFPLAADFIANSVRSRSASTFNPELIKQFNELWKDGKRNEAMDLLKAHPKGVGFADESILLTDLLAILRLRMITEPEFKTLVDFFASLEEIDKTNFRIAQTLQVDEDKRRENLIYLAKLSSDNLRKTTLSAVGVFDRTLWQKLVQGLKAIDLDDLEKFIEENKESLGKKYGELKEKLQRNQETFNKELKSANAKLRAWRSGK